MTVHDTDWGGSNWLLDNEGIIHTSQKGSIVSVTYMRAYGADVDDYTTIFTRYGNNGRSRLVSDKHNVNFKL